MKKLFKFIVSSKYTSIKLVLSIFVFSIFDLLSLFLFSNIISSKISSNNILIFSIFIFSINIFFQSIGIKLFSYISFQIVSNKFNILFKKLLDCRAYISTSDERINKLFGVESLRISENLVLPAINAFARFISTLFILSYILYKSPSLVLSFTFILALVYLVLFLIVRPKIKKFDYRREKALTNVIEDIDFLNLYKIEILIYKMKDKINKNFFNNQIDYVKNSSEISRLSSLPRPLIEGTIFISVSASILLISNFDIAILAIIGIGALKILPSMQMIFASTSSILGNISALEEYLYFINLCDTEINKIQKTSSRNIKVDKNWKIITIKNISSKTTKRLKFNIDNLIIHRGQKIAICGESGIGKSTLLNCISGLDLNTEIKIQIDQKEFKPRDLITSGFISYLKQNALIFKGTLKENITLFRNFDEEYLINLIRNLELTESNGDFMSLKKPLYSKGSNLSTGQMQRIAFLRTLLFKRPVFLLDEPTSSVDLNLRNLMWKELCKKPDCTVICVTHDLNFKEKFDKQITLK